MWFIKLGNVIKGPLNEDQLGAMLIRGEFSKSHLVSSDRQRWEQAGFLVDLLEKKLGAKTKPVAQAQLDTHVDHKKKNWFYADQSQQRGPFSQGEMERFVREKTILATTQVYSDQLGAWVNASEAPSFYSMFDHMPAPKSAWFGLGIALVLTCAVIVSGLGVWIAVNTRTSDDGDPENNSVVKNDGKPPVPPPQPPESPRAENKDGGHKASGKVNDQIIASASNIEDVEGAVGLVLNVMKTKEGKYLRMGSGSAFLISHDGFLLTNKHVVDRCDTNMRIDIPIDEKDPTKVLVYRGDIIPIVFLDGLQLQANLVHKSEQFDLAILKVDLRRPRRFFALADHFQLKVFDTVVAAGFPAVSSEPVKESEMVMKTLSAIKAFDSPQETVFPRELIVKPTRSDFNRSFTDSDQELILEHSADISPGNSGGPLINEKGVVVGINTWVPSEKRTGGRSFLASEISQMRKIIDNFVSSDVVWVN